MTVHEYLESIPSEEAKELLRQIRRIILEEVPDVEELIAYGMPTYRASGFVASFAAFKHHLSFFPGHTLKDFTEYLTGFNLSKGTIRFTIAKPIPEELIRSMIRARVAENCSQNV